MTLMHHHDEDARMLSSEKALGIGYGLGWFSIGLGLTELLAPRALTRALGMPGSEGTIQAYGVREIVTGIGILASSNPAPWIWGRVAGDALDIATLTSGLSRDNPKRQNVGLALASVIGITLLDALTAEALTGEDPRAQREERRRRWWQMVEAYRRRSGFPDAPEAMRGKAEAFAVPPDFRVPELLRPWS